MEKEIVVRRCDELLKRAQLAGYHNYAHTEYEAASEVISRATTLLRSVAGPTSSYAIDLAEAKKLYSPREQLRAARGVVSAFKTDFENGEIIDVRQQVEAIVVSEILEQAKKLLNRTTGFHPAAALLVGCVAAEEYLRNWCESIGLSITPPKRSLSLFAEELHKAGVIPLPESRRIQEWSDYRNSAAHGEWPKITEKIAGRVLHEIQDFLIEKLKPSI